VVESPAEVPEGLDAPEVPVAAVEAAPEAKSVVSKRTRKPAAKTGTSKVAATKARTKKAAAKPRTRKKAASSG
jgi:hypothetical protein